MIARRKGWQDCQNENILKMFDEVKAEAVRLYPQYFKNAKIDFYITNGKSYLGRCTSLYDKTTIYNKYGFKNSFEFLRCKHYVILLSKYTASEDILGVLVHEFGHAVTPSENHSEYWKTRANKIGEKWGIKNDRLAGQDEAIRFEDLAKPKYAVKCCNCGRIVKKYKKCSIINHPENWRCGVCGGSFKNI